MATSRPFAYNTGSPIAGTEQVGSLAVGFPTAGFSSTGLEWWNGPDEDTGYVVAESVPGDTQPTPVPGVSASVGFFRSASLAPDSFVDLVDVLAGPSGPFLSGTAAKSWLTTNDYWTSYGQISTDNLTMQLDASNSSSYSGSGTTWYSLVTPQANISLVGSPSYTSTSPGYFSFNGTTQYGTGSDSVLDPNSYTKSVWFYLNTYTDNNLVSKDGQHYMFFGGGNKLYSGHANWPGFPNTYPSTATFSLGLWYCVTLTFNTTDGMKLYINGVLDSTYTATKTAFVGNGSVNIGSYSTGNLLNGRIAKVYCYDRSISAEEVLKNYEADKEQFTPTTLQSFTTTGITTWTAPLGVTSVEYLVVGGGGGGGNGYDTGGGGGAGGGMVLTGNLAVVPGETYSILVGFGGTGGSATRTNVNGTDGGSSSFASITSFGGQAGYGSRSAPGGVGVKGVGQSTNVESARGGNGGGNQGSVVGGCGGGGGGAGGDGTNGSGSANNPISGGAGGPGLSSSITGVSVTYGAGGNGAKGNTAVTGSAGSANSGKGGGGGSNVSGSAGAGGNGGSGLVVLKY